MNKPLEAAPKASSRAIPFKDIAMRNVQIVLTSLLVVTAFMLPLLAWS